VQKDFRDLRGSFDKIASIGMFEHVGRLRLFSYFKEMYARLAPHGLFLNHGIMRPQLEGESAESLLFRDRVFPGGELAHLSDVVRHAERAGFEILDVENLRPHYALTCRAWVRRLEQNKEACLRVADGETYRTWLLYLSASSISFEQGNTDVYQVLLAKRSDSRPRRLGREYMYS
jgi:cyclopropane-fatty-acyl-phospholipid synthase